MYSIDRELSERRFGPKAVSVASHQVYFPYYYHRFSSDNVDLTNSLKTRKVKPSIATNDKHSLETYQTQRILIVDDDSDISNLFKLSLERDGYIVDAFNDPLLALSNYKAGIYDLLLLDIKMPGMNGLELFQRIRHLDDKVKVCFVTGFEEYQIEFKRLFPSLEEGDCFIGKPIELHVLAQKVKSQVAV